MGKEPLLRGMQRFFAPPALMSFNQDNATER